MPSSDGWELVLAEMPRYLVEPRTAGVPRGQALRPGRGRGTVRSPPEHWPGLALASPVTVTSPIDNR